MNIDVHSLPKVTLREAHRGPWRIERFTIGQRDAEFHQLRETINGRNRGVVAGTYTALMHDQRGVIMSDTPAEASDHLQVMQWLEKGARTFLIHGLGLGLIATWLCSDPRVERVDVVEVNADVIALVGSQLTHFDQLHVHHGDAFTYEFPPNQTWDAAWHDIWDTINEDNLKGMAVLADRYRNRVNVQDAWARDLCEGLRQESLALLREVYRQRGKEVGDEAAAKVGYDPLDIDLDSLDDVDPLDLARWMLRQGEPQ